MFTSKRLEFWSTLPREELKRRVAAEVKRTDLTFVQTQLLAAAQERLRNSRAPIENKGVKRMNLDDAVEVKKEAEPPAEKKSTPKKKPAAKKATGKVAAKKTVKKPAAKKAKAAKPNGRMDPKSKVIWAGKDNPFREGSGSYDRTELVRKADGKMVETILAMKGIKPTTLNTLKRLELIRIAAAK